MPRDQFIISYTRVCVVLEFPAYQLSIISGAFFTKRSTTKKPFGTHLSIPSTYRKMKPTVGNVPQEQNVIIPPHIRDSTDRYQFTFGSIVSPESCGEESLSPEDLDPPPTLPKISDEFFPSFPVGFLKRMGHDFI